MPVARKPRTVDLATVKLDKGNHASFKGGMCLLELSAYLAGYGKPTDHPECVSPVLGSFGRSWNDALDDETRQKLIPYAPRLLNTVDPKADEVRAWLLTDWLVHECAPAWLDCAGLNDEASTLRALPPITSSKAAAAAQPALEQVRRQANTAWAAAWDAAGAAARAAARAAAWDAAGAAAWDAAGAAAWDAAGDAAWDAAGAAAWDAAGAAAGAAAWDAAGAAAWDAAGAAAWDAAGDAAGAAAGDAAGAAAGAAAWAAAWDAAGAAAWAAAWAAATARLRPVVEQLQESAFALLDRLIDAEAA